MNTHSISPPDNAQAPELWEGLDRPLYCFGEKQTYPDECRYCADLQSQGRISSLGPKDPGALKELCYLTFHAIPSNSSHDSDFFRERIDADGLCSFCDHLRLKAWNWDRISRIEVELDPLPEIEARKSTCGFCSLVAKITARAERSEFATRHKDPGDVFRVCLQTSRYGMFGPQAFGPFALHIRQGQYGRLQTINIGSKRLASNQARSLLEFVPEIIRWERVRAPLLEAVDAPEPLDPPPTGFRLIDVENCCVVKPPRTFEYVALSYVWGDATLNSQFLHLSLTNSQSLEEKYSLQGPAVPATVQDAMVACRGLGKRYLWVDRFCIPQDEHNNPTKKFQINAMDRIYSHAVVTLVALEGDSYSGLPGVSKLRCKPRFKTQFSGREFWETNTNTWRFGDEVYLSKWSSRGWTFQEEACSPNLLFFTEDGLVGEYSRTRMFFESEPPAKMPIADYAYRLWELEDKYDFCQFGIHEVSRREFGKDSDILNAITGVLNAHGEHRFGLPLKGFNASLSWTAIWPLDRRESTNEDIFPTWSWASVRGRIVPDGSEVVKIPLATFGFLKEDQSTCGFCWPRDFELDNSGKDILAAVIAWQTGCLKTPLPAILLPTEGPQSFGAFVHEFERSYPTFMDLWKAMHGMKQNDLPLENFRDEFPTAQIEMALKPGRVLASAQMTTSSVVFKSVYDPKSPDLPFGKIQIFYGESHVGRISLDTVQDVARLVLVDDTMLGKGRWPAILSEQHFRSNTDPCDVNFLALYISAGWGPPERTPTAVTEKFTFDDGCRPCTNLRITTLAVEKNGGILRRIGVAYFRLDNWLKLPREFNAVVLE